MDEYAGRVLADRYRLPLLPGDEFEPAEIRAFDTYSGQEVLVRQVPLPEVVDAEMLDESGAGTGFGVGPDAGPGAGFAEARHASARTTRRPADPAVRRAMEAAQSAAQIPDHPRLDQVFDVFAEGGSLWVVSELVEATPLAAMLAEHPLNPYRAAEIASDVLTALRVLHAHGWTHRNITARTVLVCDDGRVVLTGLAAGAAEEALCGYDPVPAAELSQPVVGAGPGPGSDSPAVPGADGAQQPYASPASPEVYESDVPDVPDGLGRPVGEELPAAERGLPAEQGPPPSGTRELPSGPALPPGYAQDERRGQPGGRMYDQLQDAPPASGQESGLSAAPGVPDRGVPDPGLPATRGGGAVSAGDVRAARAGAIAAYRAGARAAARVSGDEQGSDTGGFPVQRPGSGSSHSSQPARHEPTGFWHGAQPRSGAGDGMRADDLRGAHDREAQRGREARDREAQGGREARGREARGREAQDQGTRNAQDRSAQSHNTWDRSAQDRSTQNHNTQNDTAQDRRIPSPPAAVAVPDGWDRAAAGPAVTARRGPGTPLAAERARQARITVVGAVTERWAPEQAGPVHGNWQLAAPVGPATDLWALGALLFRAVQGHAPYPEESAAELVQLVCAEPPAFAEECGPLRPVVESLLRQDPTERPDIEELRGWLRSLVRSAPEPDAGQGIVPVPPVDATRLPIVRRRGELVRRRRRNPGGDGVHGRHRQQRKGGRRREQGPAGSTGPAQPAQPMQSVAAGPSERSAPAGRQPRPDAKPRSLGRTLLVVVLVVLVAALVYALKFMPKADDSRQGSTGAPAPLPTASASGQRNSPESGGPGGSPQSRSAGTPQSPQGTEPDSGGPAAGYAIRKDPEGFQVAVAKDWERRSVNDAGQVRYLGGDFELVVVPGRDSVKDEGADPMAYQRDKERELKPFRDSTWSSAAGLRRIDVGKQAMAEGQFTWQDSSGREVFVRNVAMIIAGRYHVVQVIGPEAQRDKVTEIYEQAVATYRTEK
ncbi:protein kinase [Streptomyces sp. NBC_01471]|uniref:protein kinase n=1 Tax=Streptomyces sp. NBC_01471 TaxID=2903879 RepID=UPI00324E11AF